MAEAVDVLLVEDNPDDVELTLHAFGRHSPAARIHVVPDGERALSFLFCTGPFAGRDPAAGPRLVLLDLKLPFVDGMEVLRRVKADPRTQPLPIVVLTSSAEDRDLQESYRLGVNSYVVKPVDFDEFLEMARVLGRYWLLVNQSPPVGAAPAFEPRA